MTSAEAGRVAGAGSRRVTVVAPHTRVDVAVPAQLTIAELVPQLVGLAGLRDDDAGGTGWLLSRLGTGALDTSAMVATSGIVDGDVLHLTPRNAQLPPAVFDDVVDAIADNAEHSAGSWRPADTVVTGAAVGTLSGAAAVAAALAGGPPWSAVASVLAASGVLALVAGGVLVRSPRPATALVGALLQWLSLAACGLSAVLITAGDVPVSRFGAPELFAGTSAAALVAAVAAALSRRYTRAFLATAAVALIAMMTTAASMRFAAVMVAAVVVSLLMASGSALPAFALRLSRLTPAPVPADMDSFRSGDGPVYDHDVAEQSDRAKRYLDVLEASRCAAIAGGVLPLAFTDGTAAKGLAAVVGVAAVLQSRQARGRFQRRTVLGTGLLVLGLAAATIGTHVRWQPPAAFAAFGVVTAAMAFGVTVRAPRNRPSPRVARLLDAAELMALSAVLPVVGQVLGLYGWIRGLSG
ncbi:type VII secretion integral membrane protein EccD [Actinoplanes sp. CA-030573]|uniref:type VII secretion integral membrane protein EccD n=1 Tax=Actinoplanes sp. CA-030573 TaxID=3239898 RepID=UPI003D91ACB1